LSRRRVVTALPAAALFCRGRFAVAQAAPDEPPFFRQGDGQFTFLEPVAPVPDVRLTRLRGGDFDMRRTRGKVVLLNFWASWCRPCTREIPSLERLARMRDHSKLVVLAVAMDRGGREPVERFLNDHRIATLDVFLDPAESIATFNLANPNHAPFLLYGLPISYLIDRHGGVAGYFAGEADWTSQPAQRLLDHYLS
jgi:thiol-disulfide isomerase/thioredoxin